MIRKRASMEGIREGEMEQAQARRVARLGFYAALFTALTTLIAFALALTAIPSSGAFCPADCLEYPYVAAAVQYPSDFIWMLPAMFVVLSFVILIVAIHANTEPGQAVFAQLALSFALISSGVLLSNYYLQFSVIPASLLSSETDGLSLLTQYNPHGIFIALEELGYLLMSICFLFAGISITGSNRVEVAVRWTFYLGFALAILALGIVSMIYGQQRLDRFEVLIITINWMVLIINGGLLSVHFRSRLASA